MVTSPSSTSSNHYDVIVVGAGVVGSGLAYGLARSGRKVCLLERDLSEPDRIVGELLQPGGVRALKLLGMESCLEGIDSVPVEGYKVFYGDRAVPIPYPDQKEEEASKGIKSFSGRVEGRSFHHGKFVNALREKLKSLSKELGGGKLDFIECTVKEVLENQNGKIIGVGGMIKEVVSSSTDYEVIQKEVQFHSKITIIADGCFSKFRKTHGSSIQPMVRSNFVGLELTHAPLPSPRHGHVVLGGSGPVLLYQIGSTTTRILIDVPGEKLPSQSKGELQKHVRDVVLPQLPEVLQPCLKEELDKGQRLRSMPNSFLPPSMQGQNKENEGIIVVGDAMNMRHPLTGGGMSVGLWDAVHLTTVLGGPDWIPRALDGPSQPEARKVVDLEDWDSIKPALKSWHWKRKGLASVINILAQALYSLFGADDENLAVLREGCFKYFELGGECVGGPVRLLSGLAPSPLLLVYHFFSVAIYSIYALFAHPRFYPKENLERVPSYLEYPGLFIQSIAVFKTACVVLLPVVFTEMKSNVPNFSSTRSSASKTLKKSSGIVGGFDQNTFLIIACAVAAWLYYAGSLTNSTLSHSGHPHSMSQTFSEWIMFPRASANALRR